MGLGCLEEEVEEGETKVTREEVEKEGSLVICVLLSSKAGTRCMTGEGLGRGEGGAMEDGLGDWRRLKERSRKRAGVAGKRVGGGQ